MLVIKDVLVSDEIVSEKFICDLNACKGACCTEGDYGGPVDAAEMETISRLLPTIGEFLSPRSLELISKKGAFTYYEKAKTWGTTCHEEGDCVFLVRDPTGISWCGIEQSWREGKTDFRKPISCHLYPLRVTTNEIAGFEAWNYDRWDICKAACTLGKKQSMPVSRFVSEAIIRYKGADFYDELDAAAHHLLSDSKEEK